MYSITLHHRENQRESEAAFRLMRRAKNSPCAALRRASKFNIKLLEGNESADTGERGGTFLSCFWGPRSGGLRVCYRFHKRRRHLPSSCSSRPLISMCSRRETVNILKKRVEQLRFLRIKTMHFYMSSRGDVLNISTETSDGWRRVTSQNLTDPRAFSLFLYFVSCFMFVTIFWLQNPLKRTQTCSRYLKHSSGIQASKRPTKYRPN